MTTVRTEFYWTLAALAVAVLLSITGCGTQFMSAKTIAVYEVSADGLKKISYESTKEQQGLSLDLQEENGKIKSVKLRADKSSTNDESVAASLAVQLKMLELLQSLTALAEKKGGS
jgi:hypothetical protein